MDCVKCGNEIVNNGDYDELRKNNKKYSNKCNDCIIDILYPEG